MYVTLLDINRFMWPCRTFIGTVYVTLPDINWCMWPWRTLIGVCHHVKHQLVYVNTPNRARQNLSRQRLCGVWMLNSCCMSSLRWYLLLCSHSSYCYNYWSGLGGIKYQIQYVDSTNIRCNFVTNDKFIKITYLLVNSIVLCLSVYILLNRVKQPF